MLDIVLYFTAFVTVMASASENRDLESLLNSLQSQNVNGQVTESSSSDSSDDSHGIIEQLKHMDLASLVQLADHLKAKSNNKKPRLSPTNSDHKYRNNENLHEPEKRHKNRYAFKNQLLQETKPLKKTSHKRLTPNSLVGSSKHNNEGKVRSGALNEYSKIFVILDPDSLQNNANKGAVTSLLSKILQNTATGNENARLEKSIAHHYKGFNVKDRMKSRRYRHDSKETYGGGGGSMEDDYRPKRQRKEHGGGGGGGGRTAIPYIKQRGDIYERDH